MRTELRVAVDGAGVTPDTVDAAAFFELASRFAAAVAALAEGALAFTLHPSRVEAGSAQQVFFADAEDEEGVRGAQRAALRVVEEVADPDTESPAVRALQETIERRFVGLTIYAVVNDVREALTVPKRELERRFAPSTETWRVTVLGARVGGSPAVTVKLDGRSTELRCSADLAKQLGRLLDARVEIEASLVRIDDWRRKYQVVSGELRSFCKLLTDVSADQALRSWAMAPEKKRIRTRVSKG